MNEPYTSTPKPMVLKPDISILVRTGHFYFGLTLRYGNVKYFVSASKNIVHPIAYVLIKKDGIKDPLHAGPVLEDPHGPRPSAYLPEDPLYGIGRPDLSSEGRVGKAKEG